MASATSGHPYPGCCGCRGRDGAAWPASGVSPAMRGLLDALVRQLTPPHPSAWWRCSPGVRGWGRWRPACRPRPAPLQTWLVGQGLLHTEQGPRAFTATLRVPAAWLQSLPTASSPSSPTPSGTLQAALAGAARRSPAGFLRWCCSQVWGRVSERPPPAPCCRSSWPPGRCAAASVVYGRDQLQARNDPWLQMLALQASGYGREEEEADQRRRARPL